jgi:hypothetical protein
LSDKNKLMTLSESLVDIMPKVIDSYNKANLPLHIRVETFDPLNDETIGERTIDYNNREDRNWYIKNFIWAMLNGKAVETSPLNVPMRSLRKQDNENAK